MPETQISDAVEKAAAAMPRECTFTPGDWAVLAGFWHPVAYTDEVTDKPFATRLLDLDLVVYRTSAGVVAARDLCLHRGSMLSLGHDLAAELHVQADSMTIAYRRELARLGLGAPHSA
jgi:Rieske [2Fe-2S] domain